MTIKVNPGPKKIGAASVAKPSPVAAAKPEKAVQLIAKPAPMVASQGKATTTTQHKDGSQVDNEETVGSPVFTQGQPALVHVEIGLTKNLGDYNSVKFHVGITMPCEAEEEVIAATYDAAKSWVDERVEAINSEINEQLGQ